MAAAYSDLGVIYRSLGEAESAVAAYFRYLQLVPDDPNRAEIEARIVEMGGIVPKVFVLAKIAFVSERDGNYEIYSMNTDGSELTRLTADPALDAEPVYSQDGTSILFTSDRSGNFDIYSMNADGTNVIQLTDNPANDYTPTWTPDGSLIIFVTERDGNPGIYFMNPDGSEQTDIISDPNSVVMAPTSSDSADGLVLAFTSNAQGAFDLYAFQGAAGELGKLTEDIGEVLTPSWSPNGRFIVFAANPFDSYDLFITRPDGTDFSQVTSNDIDEYRPRWSPDSNYIIYSLGLTEASEIEIMFSMVCPPGDQWSPRSRSTPHTPKSGSYPGDS